MRKYFLLATALLYSFVIHAQNSDSKAYKAGYALGKAFGFALVAGLLIWAALRFIKKSKK